MQQYSKEQIFMFYNDHLTQIGVEEHVQSQHQLADTIMQRAIRMGYNRKIVTFWLLGRTRTKQP